MNPNERKATIVEAASKRFAERGYHATQISDIIEEADVARGTFYLYFKSKHEIFNLVLDDFIRHLSAQIKNIEIGADKNPALQIKENVERIVDAIIENPAIGKIIFNEAVGLDREIDERLRAFYERILGIIASSLTRGISLGIVRKVDPKIAACAIMGGLRETIVQGTIFKNVKISRGEMVDGLLDIFLGGLGEKVVIPACR